MKRRLFSILTVLALCVSMVPVGAGAGDEDGTTTPPGTEVQGPTGSGGVNNGDNTEDGDNPGDDAGEEEPGTGDASNGLSLPTFPEKDMIWTTAGPGKILYTKGSNTLTFESGVVVNGGIVLGRQTENTGGETENTGEQTESTKTFSIISLGSIEINNTVANGIGLEVWGNLDMWAQDGSYASHHVTISGKGEAGAAIYAHGSVNIKELVTMVRNDEGTAVTCDGDLTISGGEFAIYSTHDNVIESFTGADYAFCPGSGMVKVTGCFTINNCIRVILQEVSVGGGFVLIGSGGDGSEGVFNDIYCPWMYVVGGHDFEQIGNRGGFNGIIEEGYFNENTGNLERAAFIVYGNLAPGDGDTRGITQEFASRLNNEMGSITNGFKFESASNAGWEIQPGVELDLSNAEYIDLSKGYLALSGKLKLPEGFDSKTLGDITLIETTTGTGEVFVGDTKGV